MLFLAHSVSRHGSELTYAHFERRELRVERPFLFLNFGRVGRQRRHACLVTVSLARHQNQDSNCQTVEGSAPLSELGFLFMTCRGWLQLSPWQTLLVGRVNTLLQSHSIDDRGYQSLNMAIWHQSSHFLLDTSKSSPMILGTNIFFPFSSRCHDKRRHSGAELPPCLAALVLDKTCPVLSGVS